MVSLEASLKRGGDHEAQGPRGKKGENSLYKGCLLSNREQKKIKGLPWLRDLCKSHQCRCPKVPVLLRSFWSVLIFVKFLLVDSLRRILTKHKLIKILICALLFVFLVVQHFLYFLWVKSIISFSKLLFKNCVGWTFFFTKKRLLF